MTAGLGLEAGRVWLPAWPGPSQSGWAQVHPSDNHSILGASPSTACPLRWGLRFAMSNKFLGHADSAGPGSHFEDL